MLTFSYELPNGKILDFTLETRLVYLLSNGSDGKSSLVYDLIDIIMSDKTDNNIGLEIENNIILTHQLDISILNLLSEDKKYVWVIDEEINGSLSSLIYKLNAANRNQVLSSISNLYIIYVDRSSKQLSLQDNFIYYLEDNKISSINTLINECQRNNLHNVASNICDHVYIFIEDKKSGYFYFKTIFGNYIEEDKIISVGGRSNFKRFINKVLKNKNVDKNKVMVICIYDSIGICESSIEIYNLIKDIPTLVVLPITSFEGLLIESTFITSTLADTDIIQYNNNIITNYSPYLKENIEDIVKNNKRERNLETKEERILKLLMMLFNRDNYKLSLVYDKGGSNIQCFTGKCVCNSNNCYYNMDENVKNYHDSYSFIYELLNIIKKINRNKDSDVSKKQSVSNLNLF